MSNAIFNVPNNEEGRTFIKLMSKFLNRKKYGWKRWGRGRRKGLPAYMLRSTGCLNHEEVRVPYAEAWAIYISRNSTIAAEDEADYNFL